MALRSGAFAWVRTAFHREVVTTLEANFAKQRCAGLGRRKPKSCPVPGRCRRRRRRCRGEAPACPQQPASTQPRLGAGVSGASSATAKQNKSSGVPGKPPLSRVYAGLRARPQPRRPASSRGSVMVFRASGRRNTPRQQRQAIGARRAAQGWSRYEGSGVRRRGCRRTEGTV